MADGFPFLVDSPPMMADNAHLTGDTMRTPLIYAAVFILLAATRAPAAESPPAAGGVTTLWPLFDYRESPASAYSNLSILGPFFKRERSGDTVKTALRPFFFTTDTKESSDSDLLYPIASRSDSGDASDAQVLRIYQKHVSRAGTAEERRDSMIFPFYISGESEKYGPYSSFFPLHGTIYERFWRDEYHYTLFPIYSQTVKKGTTSTNWLYPFFSTISGEKESGFQLWPLYGQAEKEGVYRKRFLLWPFLSSESLGLNGDSPTENRYLLPLYASSSSPQRSSTHFPWPLCGVVRNGAGEVIERDYAWPFWMTADSGGNRVERYLPFYAESRIKDSSSYWIMWPVYRHERIDSHEFHQEKTSLLYFLFSRSDESWPKTEQTRARSAFWPLYAWKRSEEGVRALSMPALAEAVIWNDGVERNWAPFWRFFIAQWDDKGNNALSILWNLYWQERRGTELAWELSPLLSYRSNARGAEFRLLKGLFGFSSLNGTGSLSILWIPM